MGGGSRKWDEIVRHSAVTEMGATLIPKMDTEKGSLKTTLSYCIKLHTLVLENKGVESIYPHSLRQVTLHCKLGDFFNSLEVELYSYPRIKPQLDEYISILVMACGEIRPQILTELTCLH